MYSFANDYSEGACLQIMEELIKVNFQQSAGYGLDEYCLKAEEMIREEIGQPQADVHFITGGTPCNVLAISAILKPYEAVISADTGHINTHETGAVEATGHKILTAPNDDGKLRPEDIRRICDAHTDEHMVKPAMVFVSDSTEIGTIYTKAELKAIREACDKYGLMLYLDGARLGCALTANNNDLTLKDIAEMADMFYIGGTKNGALLGEAMVIVNDSLKENFRFYIKQRCSMLAKGRIVGVSFCTFFNNGLYYKLAKHANRMANALAYVFRKHGIKLYGNSTTNQIFPILENSLIEELRKDYVFLDWGAYDDNHTIVRFVTSWNTPVKEIIGFYDYFNKLMENRTK